MILLICNYLVYTFFWDGNCLLLVFLIVSDFYIAKKIQHEKSTSRKKVYLYVGLLLNLVPFIFYKYSNFFLEVTQNVLGLFQYHTVFPRMGFTVPIGISFFTLQSIGYLLDVYKGKIQAEKKLGIFAVFLSFFPQILCGPIERGEHMLPQLHEKHHFHEKEVILGIKLIFFGLCKKLLIADMLSPYVEQIFSHPTIYTGLPLILGVLMFSVQLYCDFSGYTDIAIGIAKLFGFQLNPNFHNPFAAVSVSDFWRRWHISLSSWFRDYIYIPLGGNRVSFLRQCLNVLIVFLLSGLWHGAAWTFVLWGVIHGSYIALSLLLRPVNTRLADISARYIPDTPLRAIRVLRTFFLISFAWIFFRAQNMRDAVYIVTHLFRGLWDQLTPVVFFNTLDMLLIPPFYLFLFILSLLILLVSQFYESWDLRERIFRFPPVFHWIMIYTLIFLFFFISANNATFLYSQY